MPPILYLAKWRMQIAAGLLSGGSTNIATIAAGIGYGSEAAFSRAFKKLVGVPPSAWRNPAREGLRAIDGRDGSASVDLRPRGVSARPSPPRARR
jgi:AraC-like DNA-binding protein